MEERPQGPGVNAVRKAVRVFAFPVALFGVVACAAVLGIDQRSPLDDGGAAEGGAGDAMLGEGGGADSPSGDGGMDASDAPRVTECDPTTCADAGGTCSVDRICKIACEGGACSKTVDCPERTDCELACNEKESCAGVNCVGGNSCTLDCVGPNACKGGASCKSMVCQFNCGPGTCKEVPISCRAAVCIANCSGAGACDKGIDFQATTACNISCTGGACSTDGILLGCEAPQSTITCASGSCVKAIPACEGLPGSPGSSCSVSCGAQDCKANCCDASVCSPPSSKCP